LLFLLQKKKEKKSKRRSRQSSESGAVPKLSRKTSKSASAMSPAGLGGKRCLEAIIVATFQLSDAQGTGSLEENAFWEVKYCEIVILVRNSKL